MTNTCANCNKSFTSSEIRMSCELCAAPLTAWLRAKKELSEKLDRSLSSDELSSDELRQLARAHRTALMAELS